MAAITAKMVNELRAKTGAGMMECKKALVETDGNFDEAIKEINKKNVSYKKVGVVKIRTEEFPKNTSRKITRFAIDKTID